MKISMLIFTVFMLFSNANAAVSIKAADVKTEEAFSAKLSGLTKKEKLLVLEQAIRLNSALAGQFTAIFAVDPTMTSVDLEKIISVAIAALPDSEKSAAFIATTTALKNNGHANAKVISTVMTVSTKEKGGQATTTITTHRFIGGGISITIVTSEDSGTDS